MKNPQAFPGSPSAYSGMTLRDYFAAKAMQAIVSQPDAVSQFTNPHNSNKENRILIAMNAYALADALLEVREE